MYWNSPDFAPGWKYGGRYGSASRVASEMSRYSRSRNAFRSSRVSFFIWCVALRPSKLEPSVQPLMVFARMTVGCPVCSVAALYAAYSLR
jgi:hypothetical protein